jgi:hypothetical protein
MLQQIHKRSFEARVNDPKSVFAQLKAHLDYNRHNDFPDHVGTIWGDVTDKYFEIYQSTGMWRRMFPVVCKGFTIDSSTIQVVCKLNVPWWLGVCYFSMAFLPIIIYNFWGFLIVGALTWPINYYFYDKDVKKLIRFLNENFMEGRLV